ncbi:MAG: class I SAM-dependent methyltransferase [bacterium]
MTAAALKLFSTSPQMEKLYRRMGNVLGTKRRLKSGFTKSYVNRAYILLDLAKKHNAIQNGYKLLELGTGWVHWGSIFIRLFNDVNITLFDVWDNRQLKALKHNFAELAKLYSKEIDIAPTQYERVHSLLRAISSVNSFDDLYNLLGFQYVIEPSGTLRHFQDESFNVIFSCAVLEHINRGILSEYVRDFYRLLKPGGYSIHTIDMGDHISYYDRSVSVKNYLRYSDTIWKSCFENKVQYFNRVQRSEWLNLFHKAGLKLIAEESLSSNISTITINNKYKLLDNCDLSCKDLRVVHRKQPLIA